MQLDCSKLNVPLNILCTFEVIAQDRTAIDDLFRQLPVESVVSHSLPYLVYASKNIESNG
jgi:hypothetical protein